MPATNHGGAEAWRSSESPFAPLPGVFGVTLSRHFWWRFNTGGARHHFCRCFDAARWRYFRRPSCVNLERCGATCARTKCQMCNFVGGTNFKNCYKEQNCESVFLARGRYFLTGRVALTLNVVARPAPGRFVKNVNTGVNHAPASCV